MTSSASHLSAAHDLKASPIPRTQEGGRWSLPKRIGFRFFFVLAALYLGLHLLPNLIWTLPFFDALGQFWFDRVIVELWWPAARWVMTEVLHIAPQPYVAAEPTAPMHVLVGVLCMAALAAMVAGVWSYVDRRREHYRRLHEWFRVCLRYSLGALLLSYGLRKVFVEQFGPEPGLDQLATPVGMLNSFSMLSVFMASSPLYQVFTGLVEVLVALLLMIRRTARVGALLAVPVMANVVVLNFAYHFTFYVVSSALLVMAVLLALPELSRLANYLVLDRPVLPATRTPLFSDARLNQLASVVGAVVLVVIASNLVHEKAVAAQRFQTAPQLFGVYEVVGFGRNGETSSVVTDESRWLQLTIGRSANPSANATGTVVFVHDTATFAVDVDAVSQVLTFTTRGEPRQVVRYSFDTSDADRLVLSGVDDLHVLAARSRAPASDSVSELTPAPGKHPGSIRVQLRRLEFPLLRPQPWFR